MNEQNHWLLVLKPRTWQYQNCPKASKTEFWAFEHKREFFLGHTVGISVTWWTCFSMIRFNELQLHHNDGVTRNISLFCCHLFIIAPRHNSRAASAVAYNNNNNQVWDHILTVSHHHNESLMVSLTTQFNTMWRSAGIIRVKAPFTGAYKGNFVRVYCTILWAYLD